MFWSTNYRQEFGRIAGVDTDNPVLKRSQIPVRDILRVLDGDGSVEALIPQGALKKGDIAACRAYQVSYIPETLVDKLGPSLAENFILVDENTSYLLLWDLAQIFGRATHAYAENLCFDNNDDDKNIFQYAIDQRFKMILTADSDFQGISQYRRRRILLENDSIAESGEHMPVVVYFMKNLRRSQTRSLIAYYQDEIKDFIAENDAAYLEINEEGLWKCAPDSAFDQEAKDYVETPPVLLKAAPSPDTPTNTPPPIPRFEKSAFQELRAA
ncbi:MAG: DUF5615 family PIN-like protein [Pseudobdellovibrionaceae bacterium]